MNTSLDHQTYLKQLDAILNFSEVVFDQLCIESQDGPYFTMMGLYASLIEQGKAFSVLFHNKSFIGTQAIARSVFEIYVDIKNIKQNGNYVNYILAAYYNRKKELAKKNSEEKKYRKKRNEAYGLYKREETFELLTVNQKFKLVNCQDEYNRIYSLMSGHTHSGFDFILNRIESGDGIHNLSRQQLFKSEPNSLETCAIPLVSFCLKDTSEIISKEHHEKAYDIVKEFYKDIENFFDNVS
jgi:hypothetical protein